MRCRRTIALRVPTPAPDKRRKHAIPSRLCCCPPAPATRFKAASSLPREGRTAMALATIRCDDPIPAKAGIGLRFPHNEAVLEGPPDVAFMEVHTENYMGGGTPRFCLAAVRRNCPVSRNGDGLYFGSEK